MKKRPQKSKLKPPKDIVIKIDPEELRNGITLPKVSYEIIPVIEEEVVYHGMVLPIPKVLLYYLNHVQLKIFATIQEETNLNGKCDMTIKQIAKRINHSQPCVSGAMYSMRRAGLLLETGNGQRGSGTVKMINYATVQRLNDLAEGEDPGIYSRIRRATRKTDINHMTKEDLLNAYDNQVVRPGDDPEEFEEYD